MTLWLVGKTLEDIIRLPISLDEKRLTVAPNSDNEAYECWGLLVHYQLIPAQPELREYGLDIGTRLGRTGLAEHFFRNASGNRQAIQYWHVELWDRIPPEFRDIIFFHEVIESRELAKGLPQPKAHAIASAAHEEYLQKYLSPEERDQFWQVEQALQVLGSK